MTITPRKIKRYGWKPGMQHFALEPRYKDVIPVHMLPSSVDLRTVKKMPPIYDQGPLGSCTANGIGAAIEFDIINQNLPDFMPSRLFIYYNERALEGTTTEDAGASISDGISVVHSEGVCPESEWPYDITQFATKPTPQCYADGLKTVSTQFQPVAYEIIPSVVKMCITDGFPVVFGFVVYESFESATVEQTGMVPMPQPNEQIVGGHCMLIVGYDDDINGGSFLCRNSWGTGWGLQGYCWIPYKYLTNTTLASEFYTIKQVT